MKSILLIALLLFLPAVQAATCGQQVDGLSAQNPGKAVVGNAQKELVSIDLDPGGVDGILGSRTRAALVQFCERAKYAIRDDLLETLKNHSEIFQFYPDWQEIFASADFAKWMSAQSDRIHVSEVTRSGDSSGVIAVLDRYRKSIASSGKAPVQAPETELVPMPEDALYSYMLDKEDFSELKSTDEVFARIDKLKGESFSSEKAFDAAIDEALKGVASPERYVRLIRNKVAQQSSKSLTGKSFDKLKAEAVPDYVLQAIQGLKDLPYPGVTINFAVHNTLNALIARAKGFEPEIVQLAVLSPSGAQLTEDSLGKFAAAHNGDPLASEVVAELQNLKNVSYRNSKSLDQAVGRVLSEVTGKISDAYPEILDSSDMANAYTFDEKTIREIDLEKKNFTVPQIYLEILAGLQNVDFPASGLFESAANSRMANFVERNEASVRSVIEARQSASVDQALLEALKQNSVADPVLAMIAALQGRQFENPDALRNAIGDQLEALKDRYSQYQPLVLAQARKKHSFSQVKIADLDGDSCNCVRQNLAGQVFGFYPFWIAGGAQKVNFSVLKRIEYYALGFDDSGNITNSSVWTTQNPGLFEKAHRYSTRVDLVIERRDWKSWSSLGVDARRAALRKLSEGIVRLLDIRLEGMKARLKPVASFGLGSHPRMGDGVTLYFDRYPADAESMGLFREFFADLAKRIAVNGKKRFLNVMFASNETGSGIYAYSNLSELMDSLDRQGMKGFFLALLHEPTTRDKKILREKIENGTHGRERKKLLRNIVTVLSFDGHDKAQLVDDAIYAGDNFGGIGFWPMPYREGKSGDEMVNGVLEKNFLVPGSIASKDDICRYICPNRWFFRIVWDLLLIALIGSGILYVRFCAFRSLVEAHFIRFIAFLVVPFFLFMLALLFCDPFWESTSKGNGPLILMILGVIVYAVWRYRENRKEADLP
ncbi:MAG: hypothetical protein HKL98_05940 [Burkholderiales bacterium]|nr:hypothetical protein [Burkholderiales bacterium]